MYQHPLGVGRKLFVTKRAAGVQRVEEHLPSILYGKEEDALLAKGEHVRTFPHHPRVYWLKDAGITGQQGMQIVPMHQVNRAIQQDRSPYSLDAGTHQQVPILSLSPHERVAEMAACAGLQFGRRAYDDWIPGVVVPRQQILVTGRQTDDLGMNAAVQQCRSAVIVDGAARPAPVSIGSSRGRRQGDRQIGLMNQVGANSVTPVNMSMERTVRIVLVEEVVLPFPLD